MYQLNKDHYPYYQTKLTKSKNKKGVIFFIHGYAVNSSYHNSFSDKLKDFDYYAVEHAGHGITPLRSKKQLSPMSYALDVVKLIEELDLKDIILMGHSMGGGIAMIVSQIIPKRIKKMILVTPMNSRGAANIKSVYDFLFNFNPKKYSQIERFYDILMYDYENDKYKITEAEINGVINNQKEYAKNYRKLKFRMASIKNMINLDKIERNLPVKTLLLVGKGDGCINAKTTTKNLQSKNKNIEVYEFQKSGHIPFVEEPEQYFKVIMDFINE